MPFESARLAVRAPSLSPEESLGAPLLLAPSGNYFLELFFFFFSFQSFNNVIHPFILSFVPVVYHSIHTQSSALFAVIRTIRRHNEPSAHWEGDRFWLAHSNMGPGHYPRPCWITNSQALSIFPMSLFYPSPIRFS